MRYLAILVWLICMAAVFGVAVLLVRRQPRLVIADTGASGPRAGHRVRNSAPVGADRQPAPGAD